MPPVTWAIVVTHNRKELLRQCLQALAAQTVRPDRVLVVDNASTDGTRELVREEFAGAGVELLALPENVGGAGGLPRGHARRARGRRRVDVAPGRRHDPGARRARRAARGARAAARAAAAPVEPGAVDRRLVAPDEHAGVQARPQRPSSTASSTGCCRCAPRRSSRCSSTARRSSASGSPSPHYFIWSDDIEYTARVTRGGPTGWFVPASVVEHRTKAAHTSVTEAGGRFYFHVRNSLYMLRSTAWSPQEKLSVVWSILFTTQAYLRVNRGARRAALLTVGRGLRDGLKPAPTGA
jgi:GT2 family glycosyltransferase